MNDTGAPGGVLRGYLVLAACLSGFSVMVLEMAAVRAVAPYFGASTYTWTNVIGVMLAALAAGYFFGGRLADRAPRSGVLFLLLIGGGLLTGGLPLVIRAVSRWLIPADIGIESAMAAVHRASLVGTILLFAPPTLLLGGVSPMTIRLLARPGRVGGASGLVFAASTIGSIAGTFLTTHTFIPGFGTRITIGIAGVALVSTGAVGLLLCAVTRRSVGTAAAGVGAAAFLLFAIGGAGGIKDASGQLAEAETAYQYARVVDFVDPPQRLLQINEAEESYQSVRLPGTVLTGGKYYDYYSVLPLLLDRRRGLDVLVIGLAAGTIPAQFRAFYPEQLRITGVEIDPGILDLGRRFFDLPDRADWLRPVVADGRVYLNRLPDDESFDLVVVDAFAQEVYIPFHLATRESFAEVRRVLRPGGIVALNSAGYRPDDELLSALGATVKDVFGRAFRVVVQGYPNYLIFATKDRDPSFAALQSPTGLPPTADGRTLAELARYVGASSAPVPAGGLTLTDDRAPVEQLTDAALRGESRAALGE